MIRRSRQDLNVLYQTLFEAERETHDVNRVLDNAKRKENDGQYPDFWTSSCSSSSQRSINDDRRSSSGTGSRQENSDHCHRSSAMPANDRTVSLGSKLDSSWDL
ncbi:hypothetical protein CORC01_07820 [Colletotrichum orchidophilum]|uniref:Uncharacterized protein n=1 Tax=Colletotrichum orchidophilum TaxID=1209926 RepID=A0A1G4B6B3_9PEZI|nr:uncharacterized protein CORC01_07820 [Colletotrichum orchidophilum]OHE96853.1 hypothetical protein CORC01_07820 [Colletotrichum orchidophilum]